MKEYYIFKNLIIIVVGIVGVGKLILIKVLVKRFGFKIFFEEVDYNLYLEKFYYDFECWSFYL